MEEHQFIYLYKDAIKGNFKTKYAFFISITDHYLYNSSFKDSLPKMDNESIKKEKVFVMIKNGMLVEHLTYIINKFLPTGILKFLDDLAKWYLHRKLELEPDDPRRVLSMTDLEFGFVIFVGFLSVAVVVFIWEIFSLGVRRKFRKLFGLFEFLKVLKERMKDYHDRW